MKFERICIVCGNQFIAKRKDQVFCSHKHRREYNYKKKVLMLSDNEIEEKQHGKIVMTDYKDSIQVWISAKMLNKFNEKAKQEGVNTRFLLQTYLELVCKFPDQIKKPDYNLDDVLKIDTKDKNLLVSISNEMKTYFEKLSKLEFRTINRTVFMYLFYYYLSIK